jgi:hypothetical protein
MKWGAPVLVSALGAAIACTALWQCYVRSQNTSIQQLSQASEGSPVHVLGTVIAVDPSNCQIWIEDETGALPIALNSTQAGVHAGDTLLLDATVGHIPDTDLQKSPRPPSHPPHHSPSYRDESPMQSSPPTDNPEGLALSNSAPGIVLHVTRFHRRDPRWVLLPSLSVVWLFFLNRRVRLQKSKINKASV